MNQPMSLIEWMVEIRNFQMWRPEKEDNEMTMINKILRMDLDEYDDISEPVIELLRIVNIPLSIREEMFFAFGRLAEKCRLKDMEISSLREKVLDLKNKLGE